MSIPPFEDMSEEEKERIRSEFQTLGVTPEALSETQESQPIKRGRGRPKGSRNKPHPRDYAPVTTREDSSESPDLPTLETPRLSTRDQREVSDRLAGILTGITGVASVAKPYLLMTKEEADAIAIPLSTYLLRTEATSKTARQVLEEYDIAAFVIALAAYVVRVYLDFNAERKQIRDAGKSRDVEPKNVTPISEPSLQSQGGEERPVSREFASVSQGGWSPSQV